LVKIRYNFAKKLGGEMSVKRLSFSAAEKYRVALEAIKGEKTVAELSSQYSVHATQIAKWKKQALEYLAASFTEKKKPEENHEKELEILYQQIGKLKVENDFLKKKCDLFVR
jgi:transposase